MVLTDAEENSEELGESHKMTDDDEKTLFSLPNQTCRSNVNSFLGILPKYLFLCEYVRDLLGLEKRDKSGMGTKHQDGQLENTFLAQMIGLIVSHQRNPRLKEDPCTYIDILHS